MDFGLKANTGLDRGNVRVWILDN